MDSERQQASSAMRAALWAALTRPFGGQTTQHAIREIAAPTPRLFFDVSISILDSLAQSTLGTRAGARLFECPEFLLELLREGRYNDEELRRRCVDWIRIDPFLDLRLARLVPGRHDDSYGLAPKTVARILEVLNHVSFGPRLVLLLNHLKSHPDALIAERATVLLGRRIYSERWIQERLDTSDPRMRAAAVESLWGHDLASARKLLWQYQGDENNRVAGNALLGLHFLGEPRVPTLLTTMVQDSRPDFRATATWVMGQIGDQRYLEPLRKTLSDRVPAVQSAAVQALEIIRQGRPAEERFSVSNPVKPAAKPHRPVQTETAETAVPVTPESGPRPRDPAFRFRFDGSFAAAE